MKISVDKREYDHKTYLRVEVPDNVEYKFISYLRTRKPQIDNNYYLFEYVEDSLIPIIEFLEKLTKRFDFKIVLHKSILAEIENYNKEKESFKRFSQEAFKIRNNDFNDTLELKSYFDNFESVVNDKLSRKLYPLQFLSAFHMAYGVNTMNFSVPGSGKTSTVYAAYTYLKSQGIVDKLFVIGPLSSFQAWEQEYFNCFGEKVVSNRFSGQNQDKETKRAFLYDENPAELNLIYYQGVESISKDIMAFLHKHKTMLVVDEAHRIKNTDGKWGKNITKISQAAKSRVALTGTPIPNGYEDIYNITKFIYPYKYKSILNFHYSQLQELSKNPLNKEDVLRLKANISPFFMRIRKEDLVDMPIVKENEVLIEMGNVQEDIYSYILNLTDNLRSASSSNEETEFLLRAMVIRLRQAATNPYLLSLSLEKSLIEDYYSNTSITEYVQKLNDIDDEIFGFDFRRRVSEYYDNEVPIKISYCINRVQEIITSKETPKVLIWTIFTENAFFLTEQLNRIGIKTDLLIGSVDTERREQIVKEFNKRNSQLKVVVANPFTVGESVSLHHDCNYAIYLERDYNCSNFIQSKDRIHRVGSPFQNVFYEYLSCSYTIDEEISKKLALKVERMSDLIDDEIPFFKLLEEEGEEAQLIKSSIEIYQNRP